MTDEEKKVFVKYAFTGEYDEEEALSLLENEQGIVTDSVHTQLNDTIYHIGRQYYLYTQLLDDPLKDKYKRLQMYIENVKSELAQQYTRKSQMESKAGFVLAAWGAFTVFVLDKVIMQGEKHTELNVWIGILIVVGILALLGLLFVVLSKTVSVYNFEAKWNDYYAAMEHKEMAIVRFAEGYRNAHQANEKRLMINGILLNVSIILMFVYVILTCVFVWR